MLETIVTSDKITSETLPDDIKAGQQIINIVNNVNNNSGSLNLGETEEEKQATADQMISDITGSEGIMDLLTESANSGAGSAITDVTKKVSAEDKAIIAESIKGNEYEETFKKLFGIV